MKCSLCGCDCCPNDIECDREQIQPEHFHKFACRECGCTGDSLDHARYGYDRGKEQKSVSIIGKFHKPQERNGSYLPFLKSENLDESGTVFKVGDVREASGGFSDFYVDLKAGKEAYTLGVKGDSILCDQLVNLLGDNEKKWGGKSVRLYLAKGRYINATDASARPTARGKEKVTRKSAPKKRTARK